MDHSIESLLEKGGVKPTSNRILVLRTLVRAGRPMGLMDLQQELVTLDKSSIFRVLTVLLDHHILHSLEDGAGTVRYEICHGHDSCADEDLHAHFYCENCHKVICLDSIRLHDIALPDSFQIHSINFMIKGLCPDCGKKVKS